MKVLSKEINDKGHITLICENSILFGIFNKTKKFVATEECPTGFRNWTQGSNKPPVDDLLALELDSWCNNTSIDFRIEDYILFNSFECALKTSVKSCIFNKIREIENIDSRSEYITNLSKGEKRQIYQHHKNCMIIREGQMRKY